MCLDGLPEKHRHKKQDNYPQEVFHVIFKSETLLNKDNSLFLLKRIITLVMQTLINVAIIHLGVTNNSSSHLFIRDASLSF